MIHLMKNNYITCEKSGLSKSGNLLSFCLRPFNSLFLCVLECLSSLFSSLNCILHFEHLNTLYNNPSYFYKVVTFSNFLIVVNIIKKKLNKFLIFLYHHLYCWSCINCAMAEAGIAAYGAAIGVAISLAIVLFALRGKGHPEALE